MVVLAAGAKSTAFDQDSPRPRQAAPADVAFIRSVVDGGMKAVEVGKLAQSRASDSTVKSFAERMVKEQLPTIREHLTQARSIRDRPGASK